MTRLIDADALSSCKFVIEDVSYAYARGWYENGWNDCNSYWMKTINEAPTVTPNMAQVLAYESGKSSDRPQGKWEVYGKQGGIPITDRCTNCNYEMKWYKNKYKYCPECGAKMEANNDKVD